MKTEPIRQIVRFALIPVMTVAIATAFILLALAYVKDRSGRSADKLEAKATAADIATAGADPCVASFLERELTARLALQKPLQLRDLQMFSEVCREAEINAATMQEQQRAIEALK